MDNEIITVVTGNYRSGTSMMMKMLESAGMEVYVKENSLVGDDSNPGGYYEHENSGKLTLNDTDWLEECKGKAVKIHANLFSYLPPNYKYRAIVMRRDLTHSALSFTLMKYNRRKKNKGFDINNAKARGRFDAMQNMRVHTFRKNLLHTYMTLEKYNIPYCEINYDNLAIDPLGEILKIEEKFPDLITDLMYKIFDLSLLNKSIKDKFVKTYNLNRFKLESTADSFMIKDIDNPEKTITDNLDKQNGLFTYVKIHILC